MHSCHDTDVHNPRARPNTDVWRADAIARSESNGFNGMQEMTGTRLLLVPGLMCDARVWAPQVEALQTFANVEVVDLRQPDTLTGQARVVIAAMGEDRCALAGFSMGGIVALEVMRLAADRVSRLALWNTNPGVDPVEKRAARLPQMKQADAGLLEEMTRLEFAPMYLGNRASTRPDLVDILVRMAVDLGPGVFRRQMMALRDRHDNWPVLPGIAVPTLVGCSQDDQVCPVERHRIMAERIPGADLVVIPECSHLSTVERPDAVNAAMIDWLRKEETI